MMGVGGEDVRTLLMFMDLPHSTNFGKNVFQTLKEEVGEVIHDVAVLQMKKALDKEVSLILEKSTMNGRKQKTVMSYLHMQCGKYCLTLIPMRR
eukprot:11756967-Ditylum_brightwellii.AAC.1